jgi:hypothetical protein
MRGRFGRRPLFLFAILTSTQVNAACVDPTLLAHSSVGIMRHFDDAEPDVRPDLAGIRATGWFLSSRTIVTAEHVAAAMKLSTVDWKPLEILDGDHSQFIAARVQRLADGPLEKLALIELESAVPGARSVEIRKEPLLPDEKVITYASSGGRPRLVEGRFVRLGDEGKIAGTALLEVYEGENRFVIDHGASGAPVMDCSGRVVAVVSDIFVQNIVWASHNIRIPTAWGMPNVVSLPVRPLVEFSSTD